MKTYITQKGDTWDSISYNLYGNEELIAPLMEANREKIEITVFDYGIQLIIPEIDKSDSSIYLPPWRR